MKLKRKIKKMKFKQERGELGITNEDMKRKSIIYTQVNKRKVTTKGTELS